MWIKQVRKLVYVEIHHEEPIVESVLYGREATVAHAPFVNAAMHRSLLSARWPRPLRYQNALRLRESRIPIGTAVMRVVHSADFVAAQLLGVERSEVVYGMVIGHALHGRVVHQSLRVG